MAGRVRSLVVGPLFDTSEDGWERASDREKTTKNEGGGGGRDECKASPPAIPPCRSESSRSVLSSSEQGDKNIKETSDTRDNQTKNIYTPLLSAGR